MTRFLSALVLGFALVGLALSSASAKPDAWELGKVDNGYGRVSTTDVGG